MAIIFRHACISDQIAAYNHMNGWFNPIHLHQHPLINILYCWLCIYIYPVLSLFYLQSIPMYPHYNYPHVWLNQPYLPHDHGSTHPASLKSKTEATSLVCKPRRVGESSPFPAGPVIKRGWEMLGKSSKYRWGISTVDDNKRVP